MRPTRRDPALTLGLRVVIAEATIDTMLNVVRFSPNELWTRT
jgi:hypothetical protein